MLLSDLDIILLSVVDQIVSTIAWFTLLYYSVIMLFPVTEICLWFPWERKTNWKGYERCLSSTVLKISNVLDILGFKDVMNTNIILVNIYLHIHDPSGRAVQGVDLRPLTCCDCGFESHRGHGCLSVVSVVCCQLEVSATSWSFVQRSSTEYVASLCVI